MDGNNLTSHPANFAPLGAQPALSAPREEMQVGPGAAHASLFAAPQTPPPSPPPAPSSVPATAPLTQVGVSARELLEELRTGRLVAERAFLERARQSLNDVAPTVAPSPVAEAQVEPIMTPETSAPIEVAAPEQEKHLIFALGELRYAVPLDHVIEIAELEHYTPVPNVPEWILGITNLRGDIISLVDLNALFGESNVEIPRGSNLLVAQTNAGDLTTCLVVDRVFGVVDVTAPQIQKLDQVANHIMAQHTRGYVAHAGDLLSLLDLEGLLRALELRS